MPKAILIPNRRNNKQVLKLLNAVKSGKKPAIIPLWIYVVLGASILLNLAFVLTAYNVVEFFK